jgi:dipeptidyl aminopeptidase/acylaminoacyl peptidase
VISRDNVSVKVNAVVYFRVVDAAQAVIQVASPFEATSQLAQTTLRSVLGQHELYEMLAQRDKLNVDIQRILDQAPDAWGSGYALLLADSDLEVGSPMVDLLKSVMPGIDKAVDLGVADPDRIGIIGHSYGGYGTLALIAQSSRFKAAVMRAGTGNLLSGYGHLLPDGTNPGITWSESGQGRMRGSPWEFRERYIENSPIFYLDRAAAPLLIVHGERDIAVPAFLADEVFTGLRRLGKPVTYLRYRDEGHWEGQWSYANQLDVLNRVIAWFDRHLKGAGHP